MKEGFGAFVRWFVLLCYAVVGCKCYAQNSTYDHKLDFAGRFSPSSCFMLKGSSSASPLLKMKSISTGMVSALLKVNVKSISENELARYGITVRSKVGDIWSANIPISSLEDLERVAGVLYVDVDMPIACKMDTAATLSGFGSRLLAINQLKRFDGSGVIVGVVDKGFDYTHPSFKDSLGRSRIRFVWDQTLAWSAPKSFGYGTEIADESFLFSLKTDNQFETHGTHVLGIAAGGSWGSPYAGIARNADIGLVSYMGPRLNSEYMSTSLSGVLDGVKYIFERAKELGKPAVVNLSLGFHMGPHDGTSLFDQACDKLVGEGRIIVGAAGNEGQKKVHLGINFTASDTLYSTFVGSSGRGSSCVDIWGEADRRFEVKVSLIDRKLFAEVASSRWYSTDDNTSFNSSISDLAGKACNLFVYACSAVSFNNKPRVALFYTSTSDMLVKLSVRSVDRVSHRINMWNDAYGAAGSFESMGQKGVLDGDMATSVAEIGGTGKRIISVGAFTSKTAYQNLVGQKRTISYSSLVGQIAPFSSKGPTVDGRFKPDVVAPGNGVVSSLNSFDSFFNAETASVLKEKRDSDASYFFGLLQGTSMSAPIVTGVVALLLQQNPLLTPEEVKVLLQQGALLDGFTGSKASLNRNVWGVGKVSAVGALSALLKEDVGSVSVAGGLPIVCMQSSAQPNLVTVESKSATPVSIVVYDMMGRFVFERSFVNSTSFSTSGLKGGIYLVRTVSGGGGCKLMVNL